MREPPDEALRTCMVRYQAGEASAFEELYRELAPSLRRYLLVLARHGDTADDLLQETFLQMHRSRRTFVPSRPVRPWAFAIARHVFLMDRRTRHRRPLPQEPEGGLPDIPVPAAMERLATQDELRRAIETIAADQAEVVLLHHAWGFSFEEIGKMLGIRAGAARVRASRGMRALREALSR